MIKADTNQGDNQGFTQQIQNSSENHVTLQHGDQTPIIPSPVLMAMSTLNETQNCCLYQNNFVREERIDLEMQCGKLNSQNSRNVRIQPNTQSRNIFTQESSDDFEGYSTDKQIISLLNRKDMSIEELYCNGQIEKVGYFRLVDAKNQLQSMIKYNFPDFAFKNLIVNLSNPLEQNFFKNNILNLLISINEKVPPRVIEKSKPMICCSNLSNTIRQKGFLTLGLAIICICFMILNILVNKDFNQNKISLWFAAVSILSFSTVISYYLYFRHLTLFNFHTYYNWTLFYVGISAAYFFIFISSFIAGNSIASYLTTMSLCVLHCLISLLIKEIGTKSIRLLILIKVIPESELQTIFQFFC